LAEGELCGVLNLAHRRPGAFTGADRDFVVLAGAMAAVGLNRLLRPSTAPPVAGEPRTATWVGAPLPDGA
jgi:hypothetical protein